MMSMLCNCCVRELLILERTWFAFGLPSKTGCDNISGYRRQYIVGSLFYSNFKVKFCCLNFFIFVMKQGFLMSACFYRVCC
jgi:hypothetical protein